MTKNLNGKNVIEPGFRTNKSRQGSALIVSLVFVVISLAVILQGTIAMKNNRENSENWFRVLGQANSFAKSGLVESLAWFQRQATQPVTEFAPQLTPSTNPPVYDTEDPGIGLVREFEILGSLWGRYEVDKALVEDISDHRGGTAGSGKTWALISKGIIFRRNSAAAAFNERPNRVLAQAFLSTEIDRITLTPPIQAGVVAPSGKDISLAGVKGVIEGGGFAAIGCLRGTGEPKVHKASVTGGVSKIPPDPTSTVPTVEEAFGTEAVFGGLSEDDIRSMADYIIEDDKDFPIPVPKNSIIFADCSLIFTNTRPLSLLDGNGILYITGSLTVNHSGNPSAYIGFIYVKGAIHLNGLSTVTGQLIGMDSVTISGSSEDAAVYYDENVIQNIVKDFGQYRISAAIINPYTRE